MDGIEIGRAKRDSKFVVYRRRHGGEGECSH